MPSVWARARMRISLALGNREGLSQQTARGCVATNLALPGFGSLMAGRPVGYPQAVLTVVGFGLTLVFGSKAIIWFFSNWSAIYGPEADPLETITGVWRETRWVGAGFAMVAIAWLWSLTTNAAILRTVRKDDDAKKPPKLT